MQNDQDPRRTGGSESGRTPTDNRGRGSRHRVDFWTNGDGASPADEQYRNCPRVFYNTRDHTSPVERVGAGGDDEEVNNNNNNYEDAHVEIKRKKMRKRQRFTEVVGDFFASDLMEEDGEKEEKEGKEFDDNHNFPKMTSSFGHFEQLWRFPEMHQAYIVYPGRVSQDGGQPTKGRRYSVQSFDPADGVNLSEMARQAKKEKEEAEKKQKDRPATAGAGGAYGVTGVPGQVPGQGERRGSAGMGGMSGAQALAGTLKGGPGVTGAPPPSAGAGGAGGAGRGVPIPGQPGMIGPPGAQPGFGGPRQGRFGPPGAPGMAYPGVMGGARGPVPPGMVGGPPGAIAMGPGAAGVGPKGPGGATGPGGTTGPGGATGPGNRKGRRGSGVSSVTDLEQILEANPAPKSGPGIDGTPKKTAAERWAGMSPVAKVLLVLILLLLLGVIAGIIYQLVVVLQGRFGYD